MPCPICSCIYCDHTPDQRGQTVEEIGETFHQDTQHLLPPKPQPIIESGQEAPDTGVLEPQEAEA